jgi:hypothetical protein
MTGLYEVTLRDRGSGVGGISLRWSASGALPTGLFRPDLTTTNPDELRAELHNAGLRDGEALGVEGQLDGVHPRGLCLNETALVPARRAEGVTQHLILRLLARGTVA